MPLPAPRPAPMEAANLREPDFIPVWEILARLGKAIKQAEVVRRQRKSFLLKDHTLLSLDQDDARVAARAIVHLPEERLVRMLLKRARQETILALGTTKATALMDAVQAEARRIDSGADASPGLAR